MNPDKSQRIRANPRWTTRFWAITKYELLWNIRKKKLLGMVVIAFVFATLGLVLPLILNSMNNLPTDRNPNYAVGAGIGTFGFFLFALVTAMNSISGEFESGTIVPLLTKPVSRTMVFLGKLFAAFITILSVYAVIFVYTTIGATIIYGPQDNLYLVPLSLLGSVISTFVWIAIVLSIGSISKSSVLAAIGAFGIYMALLIVAPIVSMFSDQAWILTYLPGTGATGTIENLDISVSTGTDSVAANLINYALHPSSNVTFFKIGGFSPGQSPHMIELYSEPLSFVLLGSIAVAAAYVLAFSFVTWYVFRRAQVTE